MIYYNEKNEKIIVTEEDERWCINYENKTITRQEYHPKHGCYTGKSYWHNDIKISFETLQKIVDNLPKV